MTRSGRLAEPVALVAVIVKTYAPPLTGVPVRTPAAEMARLFQPAGADAGLTTKVNPVDGAAKVE